MPALKGSKTEDNLKTAFAGESQANRRYLYFAQKADVEGYPDVAALFRSVADILGLRAYERVRDDYRARVIAKKRNRRVPLGPIMTVVFECLDTVRFQVQEMARVEKIISDEAIQVELDTYNRLLPGQGELSGTLFIELTS